MTEVVCPACQQRVAQAPPGAGHCPACGHDFSQVPPQPAWLAHGMDLRMVARRQRLLLWFVLAQVIASGAPFVAGNLHPLVPLALLPLQLAVQILIVVGVIQMLAALRTHILVRILYILLLFVPCISLLMLLLANGHATRALRKAGLRVGLMGVKDEDLLRLLGPYRCRRCGYNLIGNVSGRCPECGEPSHLVAARPAGAAPAGQPPMGPDMPQ